MFFVVLAIAHLVMQPTGCDEKHVSKGFEDRT